MKPQEAETIEKIFETIPKLSETSQARLLGIAEGMSILLTMQTEQQKTVEKAG